jgi:hypothetical protein
MLFIPSPRPSAERDSDSLNLNPNPPSPRASDLWHRFDSRKTLGRRPLFVPFFSFCSNPFSPKRDAVRRPPRNSFRFPFPRPAQAGRGLGRGVSIPCFPETHPQAISPLFVPFVSFCSNPFLFPVCADGEHQGNKDNEESCCAFRLGLCDLGSRSTVGSPRRGDRSPPRPAQAGKGLGRGVSIPCFPETHPQAIAPLFVPFVSFCSNPVRLDEVVSVQSVKSVVKVQPPSQPSYRYISLSLRFLLATLRFPRLCVSPFPLQCYVRKLCIFGKPLASLPGNGRLYNFLLECSFSLRPPRCSARGLLQPESSQTRSQGKSSIALNFGLDRIKDGIVRMVNGLPEEHSVLTDSQENLAQSGAEGAESEQKCHRSLIFFLGCGSAALSFTRLRVSLFPLRPRRLCARIHPQRHRATPAGRRLFVPFDPCH